MILNYDNDFDISSSYDKDDVDYSRPKKSKSSKSCTDIIGPIIIMIIILFFAGAC